MAGWRTPVPRRLVAIAGARCPSQPAEEREIPDGLHPKFILQTSNYLVASEKQARRLGDGSVPVVAEEPR